MDGTLVLGDKNLRKEGHMCVVVANVMGLYGDGLLGILIKVLDMELVNCTRNTARWIYGENKDH